MQNTAVYAPITFEDIVMIVVKFYIVIFLPVVIFHLLFNTVPPENIGAFSAGTSRGNSAGARGLAGIVCGT